MSINSWQPEERPREKMLLKGPKSLSDAELLAIFIRTGTKGMSAIDLGRQLIEKYGSIKGVFSANINSIQKVKGIGLSKAIALKATIELSSRYLVQKKQLTKQQHKPNDYIQIAKMHMQHEKEEVLAVIFLDKHNQLIQFEKIHQGNLHQVQVEARHILEKCILHQSSQIILVHNHPSGEPTPSKQDVLATHHLRKIMEPFQIYVNDHIIVGENSAISMLQKKYIHPHKTS